MRQQLLRWFTPTVVVVVAAACGGGGSHGAPSVTAATPSTNATVITVAPDAYGPYKVGVRTFTATDPSRKRTLTISVWYPADPSASGPLARLHVPA